MAQSRAQLVQQLVARRVNKKSEEIILKGVELLSVKLPESKGKAASVELIRANVKRACDNMNNKLSEHYATLFNESDLTDMELSTYVKILDDPTYLKAMKLLSGDQPKVDVILDDAVQDTAQCVMREIMLGHMSKMLDNDIEQRQDSDQKIRAFLGAEDVAA